MKLDSCSCLEPDWRGGGFHKNLRVRPTGPNMEENLQSACPLSCRWRGWFHLCHTVYMDKCENLPQRCISNPFSFCCNARMADGLGAHAWTIRVSITFSDCCKPFFQRPRTPCKLLLTPPLWFPPRPQAPPPFRWSSGRGRQPNWRQPKALIPAVNDSVCSVQG